MRPKPGEPMIPDALGEDETTETRSWLVLLGDSRAIRAIPFLAVHLLCLGALWTGVSAEAAWLCVALFFIRMFWVTAGYHRYFAHRTFKTSRAFQFVFAFTAQMSLQGGVLWWSGHHRNHHKHSDQPRDAHSPLQKGLWHAQVGWIFNASNWNNSWSRVRDLSRFPELRFLDRFHWLPAITLGAAVFAIWGWMGLFVGFFWSQVLSWHIAFTINSLAHVWGSRRYDTPDGSRNNALLAILTLGEGWHNNHHHDMLACRQGRRWWEVDVSFYVLWLFSVVGLVWDIRRPNTK
ncbi:MAG: stearoyl-CoA desaturase (delta-9 desaturase) [Myxococcota bacterium]|jgi:stearoyl-CoA desaturase (delta-9 desaturase)